MIFVCLKKVFWILGAVFFLLSVRPDFAKAQYEIMEFFPVTFDNLQVNIKIGEKATAEVTEGFRVIQFGSEKFSFVIPKEGVSDIKVYRGRKRYLDFDINKTSDSIVLENLGPSSSTWQIKYQIKKAVKAKKEFDEFRFEVTPSGNYINNLNIIINLPKGVKNINDLEAINYAIHGVDYPQSQALNQTTLSYSGKNLGPYSSFTAVANIPKGIISFSLGQKLENILSNLSGFSWIIFSIFLPILTFFVMLVMIFKKRSEENIKPVDEVISQPPDNISPAAAGVLYGGALGPREIAATVIDMAARGFLFIVYGGAREGYRFGERRSFLSLAPHERDLGKELLRGGLRRSVKEIEEEPQAEIFSATVSLIYQDIYKDIARLGYFVENPEIVHRRYYFAGIGIFLVSILGFIVAAFSLPYPPYLLFGFVAMAISSLVVMRMSDQMPARTAKGQKALSEWLAFRQYLISYKKPGYSEIVQETYFKWLPYAVVLGVEKQWARHFVNIPFQNPEWYAAFQEFNSVPQFTANFYPMIDYIADIMESLREPTLK